MNNPPAHLPPLFGICNPEPRYKGFIVQHRLSQRTMSELDLDTAGVSSTRRETILEKKELIIAAINDYIEGRNNGDIERLRRAFLPTATLKGVNDKTKEMTVMPVADYIAKNTPGKKHNCTTQISFVSYANEVAIGHVIIIYQTHAYYDYLVLMKVNDKWMIADKIYTRKNL